MPLAARGRTRRPSRWHAGARIIRLPPMPAPRRIELEELRQPPRYLPQPADRGARHRRRLVGAGHRGASTSRPPMATTGYWSPMRFPVDEHERDALLERFTIRHQDGGLITGDDEIVEDERRARTRRRPRGVAPGACGSPVRRDGRPGSLARDRLGLALCEQRARTSASWSRRRRPSGCTGCTSAPRPGWRRAGRSRGRRAGARRAGTRRPGPCDRADDPLQLLLELGERPDLARRHDG